MENRKLEDKIKTTVESNQPLLDHDEIWNNIEPKLKNRKRRRFVIFWFLIGGLGLAIFSYSKSLNIDHSNEASGMESIALMDNSLVGDSKVDDNKVERLHGEEAVLPLTAEEVPQTNRVEQSDQNSNKHGKRDEQTNHVDGGNRRGNVTAKMLQDHKVAPARNSEFDGDKSITSTSIDDSEGATKNIKTSHIIPATNEDNELIIDNLFEAALLLTEEKLIENSASQLPKEQPQQKSKTKYIANNSIEKETVKQSSVENNNPKLELDPKNEAKKPIEIKKKWRPRGRWVFEVQPYVAPVWAINSLKSNSRDVATGYIDSRRTAESALEAYAGGVNVRLSNAERKFIALVGIQYRRLNQRFDQSTTTTETRSVMGPVAVVENAQGDIIETEFGQKPETKTIVSKFRTYNHYTYFSVPIGIGTKWVERNYSMAVMAGIDYNLGFKFNGSVLDSDGTTISFKDGANEAYYEEVYKKRSGIDFWITAEYARKINRDVYWTVAPKIQLPTASIHRDDFDASQRFYLFGIDLGVIYLINR